MITVSIATRPAFPGSTSNLRGDCTRIVGAALGVIRYGQPASTKNSQLITSDIHPARRGQIGSVDALVLIGVSEIGLPDDYRISIAKMIREAIIDVNPGLRITVLLSSLQINRSLTITPIVFYEEVEEIRAQAVAKAVEEIRRHRAPMTKAS